MRWFRRKHDQSWEVVRCVIVESMLMFDETDIDIVRIGAHDTCRKYIFDFKKHVPDGDECVHALLSAQQQLLQKVEKRHFNVLLLEGHAYDRTNGIGWKWTTSDAQDTYLENLLPCDSPLS